MTDQPTLPPDDLEPEDLLPEDVEGAADPVVGPVRSGAEEHAREGQAAEGFFESSQSRLGTNAPHLSND